ncbi:hypothetical protein D6817_02555 [Candidatus Pacearchaeota archaeon]|nr:MAG: hypothetical protein D6817_02555 [Candidatus Pacearchaeota archaeon]
MAEKSLTREVVIVEEGGAFGLPLKRFGRKPKYDFEALSLLRRLLSKEKAKMLHTIKTEKPKSLYHLAKLLKRDFKSVMQDIKLLERFGFVEMVAERSGKRERLRPVLAINTLKLTIKI